MCIIGIDIGSSTTKIIQYENNKIINKNISESKEYEKIVDEFLTTNKIQNIDKFVLTGINAKKINLEKYNVKKDIVEEFIAIGKAGLYLSKKEDVTVVSLGTGTAFIKAKRNEMPKHIGGTGVGAGTLNKLCSKLAHTSSYEEILELSRKGNLGKIDLRISDMTDEKIETLPLDLTLSNFANLKEDASREDLVCGVVNLVAEVVGMMTVFSILKEEKRDVILIGNIVYLPRIAQVFEQLSQLYNFSYMIPDDAGFGVILGAIKSLEV